MVFFCSLLSHEAICEFVYCWASTILFLLLEHYILGCVSVASDGFSIKLVYMTQIYVDFGNCKRQGSATVSKMFPFSIPGLCSQSVQWHQARDSQVLVHHVPLSLQHKPCCPRRHWWGHGLIPGKAGVHAGVESTSLKGLGWRWEPWLHKGKVDGVTGRDGRSEWVLDDKNKRYLLYVKILLISCTPWTPCFSSEVPCLFPSINSYRWI